MGSSLAGLFQVWVWKEREKNKPFPDLWLHCPFGPRKEEAS